MGGKLSCVPCKKKWRRKRNRIFPETTLNNNTQETRTSSEILKELQELGFVQEAAKDGGLTFVVEAADEESSDGRRRAPRRLPKLSSKATNKESADTMSENSFYTTEEKGLMAEIGALEDKDNTSYNNDDKDMMVEIRRIGALADKGKMARQSEIRRKEVFERREAKRKHRIVKTKDKLEKERERLEIQTPDLKPKRPSYEERRKRLLERRTQILSDKNANLAEKVDDMETTPVTCTRSDPDGLPDVST